VKPWWTFNELICCCQATVGVLRLLSENPCEYSVWPILISGTCKKETGAKHARVIATTLAGIGKVKDHHGAVY